MPNLPTNGSVEQCWANSLTNKTLGHRLSMLRHNRRAFSKAEADALLDEANHRLSWRDNYEKHAD